MPRPPATHRPTRFTRRYTVDGTEVAVTLHEPPPGAAVPEALVQDLWRTQRFDASGLMTTDGRPVTVLDPGTLNTDAGPDFTGARVQVGGLTWRGAVEIHVMSGGWFAHEHHHDPRYDSVVLHVTLHADDWTGGLLRADGTTLPEVVLAPRLQAPLRTLLRRFHAQDEALPCAPHWADVPADVRSRWIRRCGRARTQAKADRLAGRFTPDTPLRTLLYDRLFAGLGYAKNDSAMTTLARRLPLDTLRQVGDEGADTGRGPDAARDREALLFGVAGLLPEPKDLLESDRRTADYAMDLRARFARLNARLERPVMARTAWRFFRLRPANFPTLRLAQAAAFCAPDGLLGRERPVEALIEAASSETPVLALRRLLAIQPTAFWRTHFRLTKATGERDPSLGRARTNTLLVNAVVPVLLVAARRRADDALAEAALDILRALPAPTDRVTRRFRALGTRPTSALEAQGLHHLYRSYCTAGRCLSCAIGQDMLGMRGPADGL
jgi:hypothetical protein